MAEVHFLHASPAPAWRVQALAAMDPAELGISAAGGGNAEARNLLGRCFENGWGTAIDRDAARNCYRLAAESGDFRGAHNYGCVLAADGCIAGALRWFERGIADAPLPARIHMLKALTHHPRCAIRAFAMRALESCPVAPAD